MVHFAEISGDSAFKLAIPAPMKILLILRDNNVVHLYLLAPESMQFLRSVSGATKRLSARQAAIMTTGAPFPKGVHL